MKRMVPRISAALLLLVAVSTAGSEEKLSVREMLSIAKVSGACGIVFQMREFQESTQLEGGQAFVVRFLMAEAARLGPFLDSHHSSSGDPAPTPHKNSVWIF